MTLTTHAVIGAAAARLFPNHPVLAFSAAFLSHFAADALPHWDYKLSSYRRNKQNPLMNDMDLHDSHIAIDLSKIAFDFFLGFALAFLIFFHTANYIPLIIFLGALGGMIPDPLQFAYWKFRHEPLRSLQRLHQEIHTRIRLHNQPLLGIALQAATTAFVIGVSLALA